MTTKYLTITLLTAFSVLGLPSCTTQGPLTKASASRASANEIRQKSSAALQSLYAGNDKARQLGAKASGVLVFPNITKAGLGVGLQSGQGALFLPNDTVGYYQTTGASYGLQAGFQKYGYALFMMDENALQQLYDSAGWEVGSAPSLVVVDEGISGSLSTTTILSASGAVTPPHIPHGSTSHVRFCL